LSPVSTDSRLDGNRNSIHGRGVWARIGRQFTVPDDGHPLGTQPIQINDRGEVLFAAYVWRNGERIKLKSSGIDMVNCRAFAINNCGNILGHGIPGNPEDPDGPVVSGSQRIVFWENPDAMPVSVADANGHLAISMAALFADHRSSDCLIDDDGRFLAIREGHPLRLCSWSRDPVSGSFLAAELSDELQGLSDSLATGITWGTDEANRGILVENGQSEVLAQILRRFVKKPGHGRLLGFTKGGEMDSKLENQSWAKAQVSGLDLSQVGIFAVSESQLSFRGKTHSVSFTAPKLPESVQGEPGIFDLSPKGFALGHRRERVNGSVPSVAFLPISVWETAPFSGVDSETAQANDFAWWKRPTHGRAGDLDGDGRFWIMVPKNGPDPAETVANIESWAAPQSELRLRTPGISIEPSVLTGPQEEVRFRFVGAEVGDHDLRIEIGPPGNRRSSESQPIGLKVMEKRTVKVTVFEIAVEGEDGLVTPHEAFTKETVGFR
jgi:hypothetical protein